MRDQRAREHGGGQVDGVERSNGLGGKRSTSPVQNLGIEVKGHPVLGRVGQQGAPLGSYGLRQEVRHHRMDQGAITFDQGQGGCEHDLGGTERIPDRGRPGLVQKPTEDCARLRVDVQRPPRSSSSNFAAEPLGSTVPRAG